MAGRDLLAGIPRDELLSASERLRAKAPQGRDLLEGASEGDLRAAETRLRERAARDEEAKANTPVAQLLKDDQITANKSILKGKTAGDVIAWAARKMGGALPAQAGGESFAAPDTEREPFEFSNRDEPEAAAPALIGKPIPLRVEDRQETAVVPATLQEVPVRYAVAELADLVPSNTPDGAVNPAFPAERQPRDRTRAASQNQVRNIATNLYPRLLGRDVKASDGAPIISADGVVDSGNGRVMALSQAYAQGGQQVDAYRAMLEEEGFDVSGMTQPVMVRVRDEMPAADVARFVRDSNARSTASMSGVETASTDAASMGSNLLGLYRGGDLDTLNNSDFVRGFMQAFVPASEVGDMVMKDGRPSANLLRRIEAALLVRALGPQSFVEWLVDSRSSKIKSIGNALIETSGKLAQMREAAAQGIIDPSVDISANVAEAVTLVDRARREDRGVAEFVNQVDAFSGTLDPITEAVLRLMYKDPAFKKARSQKDLTNALTFYIEQAMVTVPGGGLIASTSNPASDILALANARQDDPTARPSAKPAAADGQIGSLVDPVEDVRPAGTDSGERAGEGVQPGAGTEGSGESQADLTDNRSDAVQREGEAESVDPTAGDDASPSYRLEDTTSGKGIALFDATPAQLAAIEAAGIAKPAKRSDGAMVFSKKREAAIRAALELVAEADGPILDRAERLRMVREAVNGSADTSIEGDLIVGPGLRLNFQTASESELRSALARVTETVTPAEDDTAKARGAAAPTTAGKGLLGRNRDGNEVFEDERGVRSYVENGIRLTESVQMRPVRGEGIRLSVDVANRWESYKTTEELGQEQAQEETRIGREYDSMLSDIRRAQQQLDSFGGEQDATFKSGGVKSRERVIVKATNEDGYNSVRDIKDLARGAFIVDSMEQAEALATAIGERFTVVQDKGWQRLDSGYADHKLIVESSGIKAELQIVPSVVWNAKKAGGANKLYEEQRAPGVSEERYAELERQQQEIYSAALEATGFAQFASAAKSASGNSASASSRESETPSLVASPGASAQVESSRQTNASGGAIENTAASRNSTSLNVGDTSTSEDNVGANSQESNNAEVNRFANNTLFTADKVEAARARMKDRMKRLNAGVDPEMLIDGMVIAGAYIEDGVRNFADFAKQMRADFGNGITPYLLSFWEGARNYPGLNTEGMTSPDVSRAISEMIAADAAPTVEQSSTVQPEPQADLPELARVFVEALRTRSFASITEARAFAKEATGQDFRPGTLEAKKLDEAIEAALVFNARAIVAEGAAPLATYRQLVSLYGRQPNLGVRTSTSVQEQAYSTPAPLAYNMQTAAQNALARIEAKHGSIDAYVADKLGFTREEMGKRLSAEATDAIGLALDNMDRVDPATGKGAAFIIGDQTGIGKGRVVASVLRYAMKEGRTAIFVTEKPNLYADIYRDMMDVGVKEMLGREPVLVMTNAGESIPLGGGKELKSGGSAAHSKRLERVARGEEQFDLLMTTYSQMQTVKGQVTQRQQVLEKLAEGAIIVFDESHNAGGQGPNERRDKKAEKGEVAPNRAEFARMLARKAQGVMFSSATYAKRPEVMDLYARTDMGLAVADPKDLGEAIANGGVPLQQVLASALADAGQYVRRERTWEGVNYRTPRVPVDEAVYGDVTEILRSIREFEDAFITEVKEAIDKDARAEAKSLSADGSVGGAGVSSTNFTSVMHNIIEQMLLSLKAGPAADRALEALRAGRKPVITVANTMGSFIQEYADERNIKTGGAIDLDFGAVFERYLDRTRQYTVRKPFSKEKGEKKYISDSELGPEGLAAFRAIQAKIRETAFGPLPISPIDFIAQRLKDEGYTVGEITGRSHTIDYAGGAPTLRLRGAKETGIAGRLAAVNGFNSGKINAMILNQSGSTGLSIHASDQFKDQSPRTMIIAQAERNVDTHMQMLGRIHRTGQVVLPEYDQLVAEVPAEMRPAAVLAKKMASLNANTTGARGSAVTSDEIPDFMNDFGDEVIARIMEEDTDLYRVLGKPLGESKNGGYIREGAARKVTGRLMLLPLAEQQDFYDNFLGQYQSYLAQKEAAGEAGLEAKTLPLDARIVDASNVVAATRAGTPFGEAVVMETLDVKRLGKPMSSAQVLERISETIGASVPDGSPASALDQLRRDGEGWISDTVSQPALTEFETYRQQTVDNASEKAAPEIADRLNQNRLAFRQLLDIAYPGRGVLLYNENGDPLGGVVINVDKRGKAKNPIALSTWHVTIATADSSRQITIPLSQLRTRNMPEDAGRLIEATSRIEGYPVLEAFDSMQAEAREKRVIFTGNILAAYKETNGKGQVVNFVGEDGSVRPGIMMRRGYNHSGVVKNRPVDFRMPKQVIEWMRGGREAYGAGVSVALDGGQIKVTTAASKRGGGDVFLNRDVIAALGTDFVKTSGGMVARAPESKATAVVAALMRTGAKLQAKTDLADARQLVAGSQDALDSRPDLFDAPAQPERTMTQAQRAELEARQQQGKARRGGQQGLGDQEGGLFSSERDQGSLFLRTESGEPITGQQASELEADLRARLDAMGLQRVNLRVGTRAQLARPGATRGPDGQYLPSLKLIAVASDAVNGSTFTLGHEAVHALRDLGAISQSDWSLLEGAAWTRNPEAQASIKRRYPDLRENAQREEAVADLFGRFQVNSEGTVGAIARIIRRTLGIFEAIRNALRGKGFTMDRRAFDVLEDIRTGRTAQDIGRFETGNAINKRSNPNTPTGGPDQFAESEGSLDSRAAVVSLAGSDPTWKGKTAVAFDKFRTTMQDRYMPMLRTQRTIETMTGESLPNSMNPYLGEELMTGRIGSRLEKLHEDMIGPLFDDMARAKVNVDELETFLYARHAPERNAKMQEINPDLAPGEGSGMTDIEAMAVMNRVRKAGKMEDMERLAAKVDALRDSALDFRVESGLMSQKAADEWRSTYEYYVPLRGFKEIEGELSEETAERINKSGGGINVRGPESKRAFGRRSKADSPLSYLILQAEEAIVRGETNRVAQRFIELARANPDEDFWQVNKVSVNRRMNPESGQVEEVVSYNLAAKDKDYTVVAKIDGKEVRVTMNQANPAARRLANSMRNITQHQLDWVTKYLGTVNRYLSTVNTTLNPEFIITNAFRDMQTAAINLQSIDVPGIGKAAAGHYKGALAASLKGSWGKGSGEWKQYYDEFMLAGGRVYFNNVENVEQIRARVKSSFDMANLKAGNGGEARLHVKRGFIAVRDAIENTNQGVENAVRLAAYRAAREAGVDQDKAASIAKNLTVNFNRRGTFGPALNAAYLFYNASVQGSVTLFLAAKHRKVQKVLAGIAVAGALNEFLNMMLSDDDDDGESFYDKIPSYEKSRNMIVMTSGSTYIKIPLAYGYGAIWEAGRTASEIYRRGGDKWQESAGNLVTTIVDSFNPVGGTDNIINFFAPTILDPLVDIELNKDFSGKPILPNQSPYDVEEPDAQRYFGSVGTHWREVTDFLTNATGGNVVEPGWVDVSPETLEYMFGFVTGAAGGFVDRNAALPDKVIRGEVEANDVPFVRKLIGGEPGWQDTSRYYDRVGEVEQAYEYTKRYIEAEQIPEARAYAERKEKVLTLVPAMKEAQKLMREVRKEKRTIDFEYEMGRLDDTQYEARRERAKEVEGRIVSAFNTRWNATLYPKEE